MSRATYVHCGVTVNDAFCACGGGTAVIETTQAPPLQYCGGNGLKQKFWQKGKMYNSIQYISIQRSELYNTLCLHK